MKKIWITFSTSFKIWWIWIKTFNINSFLKSLFYTLMIKTNYNHLEELKRAWSTRQLFLIISIWNKLHHNYKAKKTFKSLPAKIWKSFLWNWKENLVRAQWMDSSSVNPLPFPDISKLTLSEEKCSGETTNQDGHCHGYALFPFGAWTWTTPKPKLEPQDLFNASTHSREAWKYGTRHKGTFRLSESTIKS